MKHTKTTERCWKECHDSYSERYVKMRIHSLSLGREDDLSKYIEWRRAWWNELDRWQKASKNEKN